MCNVSSCPNHGEGRIWRSVQPDQVWRHFDFPLLLVRSKMAAAAFAFRFLFYSFTPPFTPIDLNLLEYWHSENLCPVSSPVTVNEL